MIIISHLFSHLEQYERENSVTANIKDRSILHPEGTLMVNAVLVLGLRFAEFKIAGANARCLSMLNAFKIVIADYKTPDGAVLARHLPQHLSPNISYLTSIRKMSVSMGNAVRFLKREIAGLDVELPDKDVMRLIHSKGKRILASMH